MAQKLTLTIEEKKALLEAIARIASTIETEIESISSDWGWTGNYTDEQDFRWMKDNDGNRIKDSSGEYIKEYIFDENDNPVYRKEYGLVPKTELSEQDKRQIKAYNTIYEKLEKMI